MPKPSKQIHNHNDTTTQQRSASAGSAGLLTPTFVDSTKQAVSSQGYITVSTFLTLFVLLLLCTESVKLSSNTRLVLESTPETFKSSSIKPKLTDTMKLSAGVITLFLAAASVAAATEPHVNVKRSANAFAEALAQPEADPAPVAEAWRRYCK